MSNTIEELVSRKADTILQDIDYDIYKEDLEERELLGGIEYDLKSLLTDICDMCDMDEILDYIGR